MRIMITGSRSWSDRETVENALLRTMAKHPNATIIHGGARGADSLADNFCRLYAVPCEVYPADWERHGRQAGLLRNMQMLDSGVDAVIGFWDRQSPGTRHALREANIRHIPIWLFYTRP